MMKLYMLKTYLDIINDIILEYIWDISDGNETFKQVVHDYAVTGLGYFYAYVDADSDYDTISDLDECVLSAL